MTSETARLDWKGTGRYDWRASWPDGVENGRRVVVVKLVLQPDGSATKSKLVFIR